MTGRMPSTPASRSYEYQDKPWKDSEKNYAAMVDMIDRDAGRLFGLLKGTRD
jgi:arylsulfatase A-like enzyme